MTTAINILKPHLAINVRNVEESIEFYKKMFGIEPSKVRTGYAKFDVQTPALNFTLNQMPFIEQGALSHLGIQVGSTDDVKAVKAEWLARGLDPRDELQTDCCYALQDKAWVHDPDGNEWEVFTVIKDNLPEVSERTSGCCVPAAEGEVVLDASCACETAAPAEGEGACCDTQVKKFNIEVKGGPACCA
jgi:catechol 2,3-dioxygenase-like lactoylglutathione lyase family enzyme